MYCRLYRTMERFRKPEILEAAKSGLCCACVECWICVGSGLDPFHWELVEADVWHTDSKHPHKQGNQSKRAIILPLLAKGHWTLGLLSNHLYFTRDRQGNFFSIWSWWFSWWVCHIIITWLPSKHEGSFRPSKWYGRKHADSLSLGEIAVFALKTCQNINMLAMRCCK